MVWKTKGKPVKQAAVKKQVRFAGTEDSGAGQPKAGLELADWDTMRCIWEDDIQQLQHNRLQVSTPVEQVLLKHGFWSRAAASQHKKRRRKLSLARKTELEHVEVKQEPTDEQEQVKQEQEPTDEQEQMKQEQDSDEDMHPAMCDSSSAGGDDDEDMCDSPSESEDDDETESAALFGLLQSYWRYTPSCSAGGYPSGSLLGGGPPAKQQAPLKHWWAQKVKQEPKDEQEQEKQEPKEEQGQVKPLKQEQVKQEQVEQEQVKRDLKKVEFIEDLKGIVSETEDSGLPLGFGPALCKALQASGTACAVLKALPSCGADALQPCMHEPQACMMHKVFSHMPGAVQQEMAADPGRKSLALQLFPDADDVEAEPGEAAEVIAVDPLDRNFFAAKGLKGNQGRADWLAARKAAGAAKQVYKKALSMNEREKVLMHCTTKMPAEFPSHWACGAWWKEAAENLQLDLQKMKACWKARVKVQQDIDEWKKRTLVNVKHNKWAKKRHEARTPEKTNAPGAGRVSPLKDVHATLLQKCKAEEQYYGHRLGPDDIFAMYLEQLAERIVQLYKIQNATDTDLLKAQEQELKSCKKRLDNTGSLKKVHNMKQDLLKAIGRAKHTVQRKTVLTPAEECTRCRLTWQDFDYMLHACTLSKERLQEYVAAPADFIAHAEDMVVEFEDEVGMWVGMDQSKVTLDLEQSQQMNKRRKLSTGLLKDAEKLEDLKNEVGAGQTQVRGAEGKGEDKKRITIMHRLILRNVAQTATKRLKPKGELARTVIVLPGIHANADYMSFDEAGHAVWNQDWDYEYLGKSVMHRKGEKLGNTMLQLQHIKKAFPHLMEKFLVLQQPAAYRDAIIVAWCMLDLHKKYPYVLQQHDLLGAQATTEVKKLRHLLNIPECLIAGNMTDCLQLTDIMIANVVKSIARQEMPGIRRWMKAKALAQGGGMKYTVGSLEILMIAEKIDDGLKSWLEDYDFIFSAARQGGHLAYVPDLVENKLIPVEEAAKHWPATPLSAKAAGKSDKEREKLARVEVPPLGGAKIDAHWLQDRMKWFDTDGLPTEPDWTAMDDSADPEVAGTDVKPADFVVPLTTEEHDEDGNVVITEEEQDIFNAHASELQSHPALRKQVYVEMLRKLNECKGTTKTVVKKMEAKQKGKPGRKSARMIQARKSLNQEWKLKSAQYLEEGYTAEQMAERVVLQASKKKVQGLKSQSVVDNTTGAVCKMSLHAAKAKFVKAKKTGKASLSPL